MSCMKPIIITAISSICLLGCYDLEDGSTAAIFNRLGENDGEVEWEECQPGEPVFDDMNSGESCSFTGGCGFLDDVNKNVTLMAREANCINGGLSVTNAIRLDEETPREDVTWQDCDAFDDGRTGEACQGSFTCLKPIENSCVEKVACGEMPESMDPDVLVRYQLCDDVGEVAATSLEAIADCDGAWNARPLDPCQGDFMCLQINAEDYSPVDAIETDTFDGFVSDSTNYWSTLVWCDGASIHFVSDLYEVAATLRERLAVSQ